MTISGPKTETDTGVSHSPGFFAITPAMRWCQRYAEGTFENITVLQQCWVGSDGSEKWEDVPKVRILGWKDGPVEPAR